MNKEPENVYELTATYVVYLDGEPITNTFVVGLFKKESQVLRIMRVMRSNNNNHLSFNINVITNPYYITNLLTDKIRIF